MKIVSIVGARPEFVQVAVLSRALRARHAETLIHTGQHYDDRMSERFFADLGIPAPEINLGANAGGPDAGGVSAGRVSAGGVSEQTATMVRGLARAFAELDPDLVIVRGDTTSTLAGAIAAKQLLLPLVHIEAGMRSYDRTMQEEINRVIADHVCDIALVTDEAAKDRLAGEGIARNVHVCGDVMYDVFLATQQTAADALPPALRALAPGSFDLLTLHRAENVDDAERLAAIVAGFTDAPHPVVFPVHPRTAARLRAFEIALPPAVVRVDPLGYREMVALESGARTIFTDSGGVQREAYFAGVPCVTLRDATEWTNTVDAGWNRLAGASTAAIARALTDPPARPASRPPLFGAGDAASRIVAVIESTETASIVDAARAIRRARDYAASEAGATGVRAREGSGAVTR